MNEVIIKPLIKILYLGRLCNTVLFGLGPTEDLADGLRVEDLMVDTIGLGNDDELSEE